jgi:hypothetical protein
MRGRPTFKVHFSRIAVAASLWDYGEDDLADTALQMTDADLRDHVTAFAAITYFEGKIRPLNRTRRRPQK